ncbi:MAG TPA: SUMF1/EgtB/PvdO family nonheme iron enzyme [bacterium]|nr:SUMF1/EgtB/PvdO family nonheme iron enzyme [bacterium]
MDLLTADLDKFGLQIEEQYTASPVFRAKLAAVLKSAKESCPPDFTALLEGLSSISAEIDAAARELDSLRPEQAALAEKYAYAESRGATDTAYASEILAKLTELNGKISDAESIQSSIHPLRYAMFKALFEKYLGKKCPPDMVFIDGTYCIDRFEYPNKKGKVPAAGVTFGEATAACGKIGKRLCSDAEWQRACSGPPCRPNKAMMTPYSPAACNSSLNVMSDRPLKPAGSAPSCFTPEGLADMSGNAWEWVSDDYAPFYKTAEGGGTRSDRFLSCTNRAWADPAASISYYGARCCAAPGAKTSSAPNSEKETAASTPPGPLPIPGETSVAPTTATTDEIPEPSPVTDTAPLPEIVSPENTPAPDETPETEKLAEPEKPAVAATTEVPATATTSVETSQQKPASTEKNIANPKKKVSPSKTKKKRSIKKKTTSSRTEFSEKKKK